MSGARIRQWTFVDQVARAPKRFLDDRDTCFYYLQKDGLGFDAGPHAQENQMIINFKHDPAKYDPSSPQMYYKCEAVKIFARAVYRFLCDRREAFRDGALLIPIPTSKPRGAVDYDARLDDLCELVAENVSFARYCPALDVVRDLGKTRMGEVRRDPIAIKSNLAIDCSGMGRPGSIIVLVDDVLTTGAHFAACRDLIKEVDPSAQIIGLFLSIQLRSWDAGEPIGWDDPIWS